MEWISFLGTFKKSRNRQKPHPTHYTLQLEFCWGYLALIPLRIFSYQTASSWASGWPRNPGKVHRWQGRCGPWWGWDQSRAPSHLNMRNSRRYRNSSFPIWPDLTAMRETKQNPPTFTTSDGHEGFEEPGLFAPSWTWPGSEIWHSP